MRTRGLLSAAIALTLAGGIAVRSAGSTFVVDDTGDAADASPGDGACATATATCTLRAAIEEASAMGGATAVELPAGHYLLGAPLVVVTGALTIEGAGASSSIVDAAAASRLLDVFGGSELTLRALTLTRGSAAEEGGALRTMDATLLLDGVTISASAAEGHGGGLFAAASDVTILDSTFDANTGLDGGAAAIMGGELDVTGSTFTRCLAADAGGALAAFAPDTLSVTDCTFDGNAAERSGGAVWLAGKGDHTIVGSTFTANQSLGGSGGAIAADGLVGPGSTGTLAITDGAFTANQADVAGGAIHAAVIPTLSGNVFANNQAPNHPDVSIPVVFELPDPDACADAALCDDHDACTTDTCSDGACTNTPLAGFALPTCRVQAIRTILDGAPTDALPARWKKKLEKRLRAVTAKLEKTIAADEAGKAKKRRAAGRATVALAKRMRATVAKGVRKHGVDASLGTTLTGELDATIAALSALLAA